MLYKLHIPHDFYMYLFGQILEDSYGIYAPWTTANTSFIVFSSREVYENFKTRIFQDSTCLKLQVAPSSWQLKKTTCPSKL